MDLLQSDEADAGDGRAVLELGTERGGQQALEQVWIDSVIHEDPAPNYTLEDR